MEINHIRRGAGPRLLLVHGLGGSVAVWRPVLDSLSGEREVIAVDMPGFGRSPDPGDGFVPSAANLAGAIAEFCAANDFERPHVAGNSLGGWVALEMAKRDMAASVCAISPAGMWRQPIGPRRFENYDVGNRIRPVVGLLLRSERGRRLLLERVIAWPERLTPEEASDVVLGYLNSPGWPAANSAMRNGALEGFEEIDVPVTIAWGELDRTVGRPSRSRRPPGTRYLEMPGWGHTPMWDDPEGVAKLILEASSG
jgi:pimeloyl-ACP methyl ester carboxylesterase